MPVETAQQVRTGGVEEVVADKGYHSNEVLVELGKLKVRTYIAEPDRGQRSWQGKPAAQAAVYGNRRRIGGARRKRLLARRGERVWLRRATTDTRPAITGTVTAAGMFGFLGQLVGGGAVWPGMVGGLCGVVVAVVASRR